MLNNFQRKPKSVNVIHIQIGKPLFLHVRMWDSLTPLRNRVCVNCSIWVCMNALHCISGKQHLFFHFTLGTMTFFADLRTLSFNNSWTWKATTKFLWKYSRKQQIHLWLAYPETSFIFSILLISTMRKICLCQCFQGAFNSGLSKNLAALSRRSFFQPSLVHVSQSWQKTVFKEPEICKLNPNLHAGFITRKTSAPIAQALRFLILLIHC